MAMRRTALMALVVALPRRRQCFGGRARLADGDHRARRRAVADHRLRRRRADRLPRALRRRRRARCSSPMCTWTTSPVSSACSSPTTSMPRGAARRSLYVPATVVPLLHKRVADYPNVLAEGGANFWDAFQLVPVGDAFWHDGVRLEVFPVRHHWPETAFGLRLRGSLVWTGDTRPIPEMLARHADDGELVAHDCALHGNPSHSGIDDLEREYPRALLAALPAVPLRQRRRWRGAGGARPSRRDTGRSRGPAPSRPRHGHCRHERRPARQPPRRSIACGRPMRDLRLSVIEACNFRCGYCMPADRVPDDYGMDAASRMSFDEIETLVRGFARLGVHKLRLTGGEPLLRKRLPELVARLVADPRHRRPGADHQRLAACAAGARIARGRAATHHGQPRYARSRACSARCPAAAANSPTCWPASPPRKRPVSSASRSTASCSAASTRTRCCRWSNASAAAATSCASSNTWTSAPATAGTASRVVPSAELRDRIARALAAARARRQLSRRGRLALRLRRRRRRGRFRQLDQRAVLRRLPSRAHLGGRPALHLPVRRRGHRPAAVAAAGRGGIGRARRGSVDAARRSLQRAARHGGRVAQARRNVPDRWLMTWRPRRQDRSPTSMPTAGRPWSMSRPRP